MHAIIIISAPPSILVCIYRAVVLRSQTTIFRFICGGLCRGRKGLVTLACIFVPAVESSGVLITNECKPRPRDTFLAESPIRTSDSSRAKNDLTRD